MTGVFLYAYNKRKGHALSSSANQNLRLLSKSLMFSASQHEHAENGVALGAAGLSNGVDVGGGVGNGTLSNDDGQANDMVPVSLSVVSVGLSATRVVERK
eukprot:CAMPEP_0175072972 /NCGR_PEP_ID=MMETSP0052_2-20121109/20255_1 /TAXON_ID=51329 ORGANISM="Polytomella parva, Strain SAG 63-3" /NCGR_SAMPLE_ID=MMETSP0052_2 /ASSEMBLY_ACC=CAM_ASM_000194 /LENGTH=99 /DNA_ID=CAMNT_0016340633 /DNA_START=813 /DNA_END=1109 /DNA_ORIENTATION=+